MRRKTRRRPFRATTTEARSTQIEAPPAERVGAPAPAFCWRRTTDFSVQRHRSPLSEAVRLGTRALTRLLTGKCLSQRTPDFAVRRHLWPPFGGSAHRRSNAHPAETGRRSTDRRRASPRDFSRTSRRRTDPHSAWEEGFSPTPTQPLRAETPGLARTEDGHTLTHHHAIVVGAALSVHRGPGLSDPTLRSTRTSRGRPPDSGCAAFPEGRSLAPTEPSLQRLSPTVD